MRFQPLIIMEIQFKGLISFMQHVGEKEKYTSIYGPLFPTYALILLLSLLLFLLLLPSAP